MKKKTPREDFKEIMDLSAEIGLQISCGKDCLNNAERFTDTYTYKHLVFELLKAVDTLAAEINEIAYKNI